jgi:hypothetical protein
MNMYGFTTFTIVDTLLSWFLVYLLYRTQNTPIWVWFSTYICMIGTLVGAVSFVVFMESIEISMPQKDIDLLYVMINTVMLVWAWAVLLMVCKHPTIKEIISWPSTPTNTLLPLYRSVWNSMWALVLIPAAAILAFALVMIGHKDKAKEIRRAYLPI